MITHSRFSRLGFVLAALTAALAILFAAQVALALTSSTPNTADVVVNFGNGRLESRRITFTAGSLTGLQAVSQAYSITESGGAICAIDGVGCPASDCFCKCPPPYDHCLYWNYAHLISGTWQTALEGAGTYAVVNRAADGFAWDSQLPSMADRALGAQAALNWLRGQQLADGSFPGFGGNTGSTLDSVLAIRAAGEDPAIWRSAAGHSPIDYLEAHAAAYVSATSTAQLGKLALGLAAADADPAHFWGLNLVVSLTQRYNPQTGAYGGSNWDQAFAILGLAAAGETVPPTATAALRASVATGGGWGYSPGDPAGDADSTGLVLQALRASGEPVTASAMLSGVVFLKSQQNADGGFTSGFDPASNANSTALAVQGILAAGVDPLTGTFVTISNSNPIAYLLSQQDPDGGIQYEGPPSSLIATQQTIPALQGRVFPLPSRSVALRKALAQIGALQTADGGFAGAGVNDSIDAILAIRMAGGDPQAHVSISGTQPLQYLGAQAAGYATDAATTGKLIVGVVAAGGDPHQVAGMDLVVSATGYYSGGHYGGTVADQAWAILGLVAARAGVPVTAPEVLLAQAVPVTGGWGRLPNASVADADSTGLALQALAAAGVPRDSAAVSAGLDALHAFQQPDAGFAGLAGTSAVTTTAYGLRGAVAYGEQPRGLAWQRTMTGAVSALVTLNPLDTLLVMPDGCPRAAGQPDPQGAYACAAGVSLRMLPVRPVTLYRFPRLLN